MEPKKLSVLTLNCRSIRSQSRRALLQAIIEEHQADIVVGCESHLDDTYLTQEIFPSGYGVIRKDRNSSGGGVFLAIRNNLLFLEEPIFHGDTEMVWVKLCLDKSKPIYICSFYRPPNTSVDSITEFRHLLSEIFCHNSDSPRIIVAGDFNLPDTQWEEGLGHINPSPVYGYELNALFVETMNDYGFEQLVDLPTRGNHILDLVISTHPDIVSQVEVVPGISDHKAITFKLTNL